MPLNKKHTILVITVIAAIALLFIGLKTVTKKHVEKGDTVSISYIGRLENGEVFDTNLAEEAKKAGTYQEGRTYDDFTFTLGEGQVIQGFDEGIIGMKEGESKELTIPAEKAYGPVHSELILKDLKRQGRIPRYSDVEKAKFTDLFDADPKLGDTLEKKTIPWKVKVTHINDTSVTLENLFTIGTSVTLPGTAWPSEVKAIATDFITLHQNPEEGMPIILPYQQKVLSGTVKNVREDLYDIDLNHHLAGKTLIFTITVKNIEKGYTKTK